MDLRIREERGHEDVFSDSRRTAFDPVRLPDVRDQRGEDPHQRVAA
jgi:hypothetical protein